MTISYYLSKTEQNKTYLDFFFLLGFCFGKERGGDMKLGGYLGGVEGEENTIKMHCMKITFN